MPSVASHSLYHQHFLPQHVGDLHGHGVVSPAWTEVLVQALAAALANLTEEQRQALAGLLGHKGE
jgi:hypothetical protein